MILVIESNLGFRRQKGTGMEAVGFSQSNLSPIGCTFD